MTDDRTTASSPPPGSPEADATPALHRPHAWKRRRNAVRVFSILTVLALVGLGWLAVQGYDAARRIKGGATATIITDPAAPGFVAAVDATPVHLVALTDAEDALSALVVFVPDPGGGRGSIIWSLGELVVEIDGDQTALTDVYESQGFEAARAEFEKVLGFGSTDALIVSPADLAAAAGAIGTIEINNPDPVSVEVKGKRTQKFKSGSISLEPDQLGEFLTVRGAGEAPANRATRSAVLFSALAQRFADPTGAGTGSTAGSSPSSAPTAADGAVDLTTILLEMGAADPDFLDLPMTRMSFKGSFLYSPDAEAIADELSGVVQFPISSFPGQRPRVRILNGTVDTAPASAIAPDLAAVGGEVLLVGNANPLDAATSSVVYSDDSFKDVADRIAEVVGVPAERSEELSDAADIDVVLGADYQR